MSLFSPTLPRCSLIMTFFDDTQYRITELRGAGVLVCIKQIVKHFQQCFIVIFGLLQNTSWESTMAPTFSGTTALTSSTPDDSEPSFTLVVAQHPFDVAPSESVCYNTKRHTKKNRKAI